MPKEVTLKLGLKEGSMVNVVSEQENILIKPKARTVLSLEEMMSKVTRKNIHKKIDWGKSRGREIWL